MDRFAEYLARYYQSAHRVHLLSLSNTKTHLPDYAQAALDRADRTVSTMAVIYVVTTNKATDIDSSNSCHASMADHTFCRDVIREHVYDFRGL